MQVQSKLRHGACPVSTAYMFLYLHVMATQQMPNMYPLLTSASYTPNEKLKMQLSTQAEMYAEIFFCQWGGENLLVFIRV